MNFLKVTATLLAIATLSACVSHRHLNTLTTWSRRLNLWRVPQEEGQLALFARHRGSTLRGCERLSPRRHH